MNGAFQINASQAEDHWLFTELVLDSAPRHVLLSIDHNHLVDFMAETAREAIDFDAVQALVHMHSEITARLRLLRTVIDSEGAADLWRTLERRLRAHDEMESVLYGHIGSELAFRQ